MTLRYSAMLKRFLDLSDIGLGNHVLWLGNLKEF